MSGSINEATLRVARHPDSLELVRTVVSTMAAGTDMAIDVIEDLRIAIDEAMSLLIGGEPYLGEINCMIRLDGPERLLAIEVEIDPWHGVESPHTELAWLVLRAVTDEATVTDTGTARRVRLTRRWSAPASAD